MKQKRENLYEGMFIISPTLSEQARSAAVERISKSLESRGGDVKKVHEQGRKKLAYDIRRNRDGYYYILYFTLPCEVMNDFWQDCHLNEDVLRFMTLKVEEVKETIEFPTLATSAAS